MKHLALLPALSVLLFTGCAATGMEGAAPGASAPPDDAHELAELEHDLAVAQARLEVARLELEAYKEERSVAARHALAEIGLAEASVSLFHESEAPNRLASARLDLRSASDRAKEAADELAQIEIMYADQDLDDLTAEFVVSRGRRSAERAAQRIEILERELRALEERELPTEEERRALALDRAQAKLRELARATEIGRRGKTIALMEAEREVERLETELAEKQEQP